jgi:hypothetical protein
MCVLREMSVIGDDCDADHINNSSLAVSGVSLLVIGMIS